MAGDGNTRNAKTTRVSQHRMPDDKNVLLKTAFFLNLPPPSTAHSFPIDSI